MILRVANPIYDSVFKYLVEDLRIAKILISALLKKEVLEVEVRKHEYTNDIPRLARKSRMSSEYLWLRFTCLVIRWAT